MRRLEILLTVTYTNLWWLTLYSIIPLDYDQPALNMLNVDINHV